MQRVAQEMNLSETAFLHVAGDGYRLRWFTPAVEVDLCGHATLASAHVLWESGYCGRRNRRFQARNGLLLRRSGATGSRWISPLPPPPMLKRPPGLLEALGVTPLYVGKTKFDYVIQAGGEQKCARGA